MVIKMDFIIKAAEEHDYSSISECWAAVRGKDYYSKDVYKPDYIKENSVFAIFGSGGETIAAIAASRGLFGDDYNYLGMLAVREEYIGNGLATMLLRRAIESLRERGASCMKAHIVTDANIVQKMTEKEGLLPTGILFGVRDSKKMLLGKKINCDKCSLIVYVKANAKTCCGELFIPKSLNRFTEKVYKSLGVLFTIKNECEIQSGSIIQTHYDHNHSVIYVKALKCGSDIRKKFALIIAECERMPLFTVTLLININDPSAIYGFCEAKKLGLIFCGFEPLDKENEYIIMFYKNNVDILINEIKTTGKSDDLLKEVINIEEHYLR